MIKLPPEHWKQVFEWFDEAVDLPPTERDTWVERVDSRDPALKAALRELLLNHARAETSDILGGLPQFTGVDAAPAGNALAAVAGSRIGAYLLQRELGHGGMGSVWLAERVDGKLKRQVAVKMPHLSWSMPDLAARMARERDILARLEHPNIARLYDADVTPLGQPYLVLEYVDGEPIDEHCDRLRLTIRQRLELFGQVLSAVQYAHAHLVVHRDLKPSNILVTESGVVRLLDFGVARLVSEAESGGARFTQAGGRMFTLDYASPEQIAGGAVTTSSDVYSLGVVLYELLAGMLPYRQASGHKHALEAEILEASVLPLGRAAIASGRAEQLSTSARQLRRLLRGDISTIVHKALRREPLARYSSADAMAQDIQRFTSGRPITARPASFGYLLQRFVTRNAFVVSIAAAAIIALLIATSFSIWQARIAQAQRNNAVRAAARSLAISAFLDNLIIDAPLHGAQMSSMETLERSTQLARKEFAAQPDYLAEMLVTLARNYRVLGDAQKSMALLDEARQVAKNSEVSLRASIECRYGQAVSRVDGMEAARKIIDAALALEDVEPAARAVCYQALAFAAQDTNDGPGALRYASAALEEARKDPTLLPESELSLMADLAYAYLLEAEVDRADALYRQIIERDEKLGFARSPVTLTVRSNWAMVAGLSGEPEKSLAQYDFILRVLAEDDPGSPPPPHFLGNRGYALELAGRYQEAEQEYRHCEQVASAANNSRWSSYCVVGLASIARVSGDLDLAESLLRKLETQGGTAAGTSADRRRKLVQARIALDRGDFETSKQVFSSLMIPNARAFSAQTGLSEALLKAGDATKAIEVARESLANSQRLQQSAPYSINTGLSWHALAQALASHGDIAEARSAFEAALVNLKKTADARHPAIASASEWLSQHETARPTAAK